MQKRFKTAVTAVVWVVCAFASTPGAAQERLLGRHAISIQLKPMPAAEALKVLSERSKLVSQHAEPSEEEGEPWEIANPSTLDGLFVKVSFASTPVNVIVKRILGCLGFGYREVGNRIEVHKAALELSGDRCQGVQKVDAFEARDKRPERPGLDSWQYDSIPALEFVDVWSKRTGQNVLMPYDQRDLLRKINVRVSVVDASDEKVLDALTRCIGWGYSRTSSGYSIFMSNEVRAAADCRGITVL